MQHFQGYTTLTNIQSTSGYKEGGWCLIVLEYSKPHHVALAMCHCEEVLCLN